MSEYFKNPLDNLHYYRLEKDGKLYELDIVFGQWNDITDSEMFSAVWEPCDVKEIDYFRLFIYVEQSSSYFAEHSEEVGIKNYEYGDDYNFYITGNGVLAIDEKKNGYKCSPKIMVPTMQKVTDIEPDWASLPLENAIDYIENQEGIFMSDMELFYDENGDVQGITKDFRQFKLSLKTGELNEVFDNIGIDKSWSKCSIDDDIFDDENNEILLSAKEYEQLCSLHEYLNLTGDYGKYFEYYKNPFGCIYAKGEDGKNYLCSKSGLKTLDEKVINNNFNRIARFYVPECVKNYYAHKEELKTKEIKLNDLVLFISPFNEIYGVTEDCRAYILSSKTGELEQLSYKDILRKCWKYIDVSEAIKIQAMYKGEIEYKNYINFFKDKLMTDGTISSNTNFAFFKEPLGQDDNGNEKYNIYALDSSYNEYLCTSDAMKIIESETIQENWPRIESFCLLNYLNNLC